MAHTSFCDECDPAFTTVSQARISGGYPATEEFPFLVHQTLAVLRPLDLINQNER